MEGILLLYIIRPNRKNVTSLLKEVISGLGCDCKKTSMLTIVSYWY